MKPVKKFAVAPGWKVLFIDIGMEPNEILKHANLPTDLFNQKEAFLTTEEYFRLWRAMESVSKDPKLALTIINKMSSDMFSPPLFAAYCSPNLLVALRRLQQYKPLIGPMKLEIAEQEDQVQLTVVFMDDLQSKPTSLVGMELGFFVKLARLATRENIVPLEVVTPTPLADHESFSQFFGVTPKIADTLSLSFSAQDAQKSFITENAQMWDFFEPSLKKRLHEVSQDEGIAERVRTTLLELLPSGRSSIDDAAKKLLMSRRTLQRRLGEENTSFKKILTDVREELARHYLTRSDLPYSQISYLLGYEDPSSFFRAFHSWTGKTPNSMRAEAVH